MFSSNDIGKKMLKIQSRELLSEKEFRDEFLAKQLPVHIAAGAKSWPAIKKWDDEYLKNIAGDFDILAMSKSDYSKDGNKRINETSESITLKKLLDIIGKGEMAPDLSYVRQTNILAKLPLLADDIKCPAYLPDSYQSKDAVTWMGPVGTVAQMHWDTSDNLFAQVRGNKRFILVPPAQSALTYPNKILLQSALKSMPAGFISEDLLSTIKFMFQKNNQTIEEIVKYIPKQLVNVMFKKLAGVNNCHVNAEYPDLSKHPLFSEADRYSVDLEPGDLLFIPNYWRHYVRSLSSSISVNWFFKDPELPGFSDYHIDSIMRESISQHLTTIDSKFVEKV